MMAEADPSQFYPAYQCTLSSQMIDKAKKELHEDPKRRQDDIRALREWLLTQKHICSRLDDVYLLCFLRGSKFSLQTAKRKLDLYHTLITHCPEQLRPLDTRVDPLREAFSCGAMLPMLDPLPGGQGLIIVRAARRDPERMSQDTMFLAANMIREMWLEQCEWTQVAGVVGIVDLQGMTGAHAVSMTPTCIKKAVTIWEAAPVRQKEVHYVNVPAFAETVISIFRRFMKPKLQKRLHVHSGDWSESLRQHFPPDILPPEYGGRGRDLDSLTQFWLQKMGENGERFLDAQRFGVDEKLRDGRQMTSNDLFGIEGSFRQLEID